MIERMLFFFNFGNTFILIFLNIFDIELEKEDLDTDKSENFNVDIQMYLISEREYKEFIVIGINLNIVRNDGEEYLYNEDDFYLESNNVGYNGIIQMNCIYNYCIFHLRFTTINNFFFKIIFKSIKKIYREEEIKHQIFIIKITIYRTFILLFEYLSIYVKEGAILERY